MKDSPSLSHQIRALNRLMYKSVSLKYTFLRGVIYGVGFLIGSAIVAVLIIGALAPFIARIPFVEAVYEEGSSLLREGSVEEQLQDQYTP